MRNRIPKKGLGSHGTHNYENILRIDTMVPDRPVERKESASGVALEKSLVALMLDLQDLQACFLFSISFTPSYLDPFSHAQFPSESRRSPVRPSLLSAYHLRQPNPHSSDRIALSDHVTIDLHQHSVTVRRLCRFGLLDWRPIGPPGKVVIPSLCSPSVSSLRSNSLVSSAREPLCQQVPTYYT
ncbi:hypothetical protein K439DRAFT_456684 [Ramaria rubella]|nr:hypothetical protein K439DRAFT_456684 [Ramaria rubella]